MNERIPMEHKPRVQLTVAIEGPIAWRHETEAIRVVPVGKRVCVVMPANVIAAASARDGRIRVSVSVDGLYDTPKPDTLWTAWHAVVALAPPELHDLFEDAGRPQSWKQWDVYQGRLVDTALERAQIVSTTMWGDRARCPYCGDHPISPGPTEGFAYPNGLIMHLEGKGNAHRCIVMRVLTDWARFSG
jgi:hypothetical protein